MDQTRLELNRLDIKVIPSAYNISCVLEELEKLPGIIATHRESVIQETEMFLKAKYELKLAVSNAILNTDRQFANDDELKAHVNVATQAEASKVLMTEVNKMTAELHLEEQINAFKSACYKAQLLGNLIDFAVDDAD